MKAPRHAQGLWRHLTRGALTGLCLWAASPLVACEVPLNQRYDVVADSLVIHDQASAQYGTLSDRYAHGVLGDALEPTTLHVWSVHRTAFCWSDHELDQAHVFEDLAPRLHDLTSDGFPEIITIRSHRSKGAQIAIYAVDENGKIYLDATTPYIGTRFRWLAPIAVSDLDGDGYVEIAYIDRPHLAKRLRIWRYRKGELVHIADEDGLTNHRIGEDFITGGLRTCAGGPELIVVDANWSNIMAVTYSDDQIRTRQIARFSGRDSVRAVLTCS